MAITETSSKKRPSYLIQYYITAVLLILLLIFNIFIWQIVKNQLDRAAEKTEQEKIEIVANNMRVYMHEYEETAIFGSVYLGNDLISRKSFDKYFSDTLKTHGKEAQAISSILYVEKITDLEEFKKSISKNEEFSLDEKAFYKITPYETVPAYVVKYVYPFEENRLYLGYNTITDEEQSVAMEKSSSNNSLAATRKRSFINKDQIVIYNPVYSHTNPTEMKGYVAVLIDPKRLFQDLESIGADAPFAVYEGKINASDINNKELYFESGFNPLKGLVKTKVNNIVKHVHLADQPLTFIFTTPKKPTLPNEQQLLLNILLHGGSGIIFILFVIVNLLIITVSKTKSLNNPQSKIQN